MSELAPILAEIEALHDRKAEGYGRPDEPFFNIIEGAKFAGIEPWVASLLRAGDKAGRLSLAAQGNPASDESIEDNLLDGISYWCIALALWRRGHKTFNPLDLVAVRAQVLNHCELGEHDWSEWLSTDHSEYRECQFCPESQIREPQPDLLKTDPGDWQALEHKGSE